MTAQHKVLRMLWSNELALGADEDMISDGDKCRVENNAVIVDERPLPYLDSVSVVTMEGRTHGCRLRHIGNQVVESLSIARRPQHELIESLTGLFCMGQALGYFRVGEIIEFRRPHLFKFCLHIGKNTEKSRESVWTGEKKKVCSQSLISSTGQNAGKNVNLQERHIVD